jgi:two-component system nitrogen regulation sensor histidine kinase NtrY
MVLLVVFTTLFTALQHDRNLPEVLVADRVLLFFLRNVNALLILVILFSLSRSLFKLWTERRAGAFGSRFKTKLLTTYIGLSLVPVLLLFLYASELLKGAVDRWFSKPLEVVLETGAEIGRSLHEEILQRCRRDAARLATELARDTFWKETSSPEPLTRRLLSWRNELEADVVAVFDRTEFVQAVVDPASGLESLPELGRRFLLEILDQGTSSRILELPTNRGRLLLSGVAAPQMAGRRIRPLVVVGVRLDPLAASRTARLIEAYQSYRKLEVQKAQFKTSYSLLFLLITCLILLASAWTGLYLSRRLLTPILALAEGTRRISEGDLDHRIDVVADDEVAIVIESFNRMAEELERNRKELESREIALVESNRALENERQLLATVLERLAAGVLAADAEGKILVTNRAAARALGRGNLPTPGSSLLDWLDPRSHGPVLQAFHASDVEASRTASWIVDGQRRTFELRVADIPALAGVVGRVLVLEDLTDQIRFQQQAAWSEVARRIAHELRNPLTPIRLAVERIQARCPTDNPAFRELVEESTRVVVREVEVFQNLVEEFGNYARMPGPRFAPTELDRLAKEVVALYRDLKPGVTVVARAETPLEPVWVDAAQIRRALLNLLDNAVEATDPPGSIEVRLRLEAGIAVIQVADTGRGIPPEDRDKLFLPFFSRKGRGTGMGLAIVHRIVRDHGGEIRVEPQEPRGTIFRIELPVGYALRG